MTDIINLTQHAATDEQAAAGVVELQDKTAYTPAEVRRLYRPQRDLHARRSAGGSNYQMTLMAF
jgi:hypothetical protein